MDELEKVRVLFESQLAMHKRASLDDAPFGYDAEQAWAYHTHRASILNWVLEMLPQSLSERAA